MKVMITGAAGFLGTLLVKRLMRAGPVQVGGREADLTHLHLTDQVSQPAAFHSLPSRRDGLAVSFVGGSLSDLLERSELPCCGRP